MATTGELRAIIAELELVDIGDAASYLGEEATVADEFLSEAQEPSIGTMAHPSTCDCIACQIFPFC